MCENEYDCHRAEWVPNGDSFTGFPEYKGTCTIWDSHSYQCVLNSTIVLPDTDYTANFDGNPSQPFIFRCLGKFYYFNFYRRVIEGRDPCYVCRNWMISNF